MASPATIESLVRAVYDLNWVKRDVLRRSGADAAVPLGALAAVHRLGAAKVTDVAAALHVDVSVASRQVRGLVEAGLVDRAPDPADGRAQLLRVTSEGRAALERAHARLVEAFGAALEDWSEDEIAAFTAAAERLRTGYERAVAAQGGAAGSPPATADRAAGATPAAGPPGGRAA
jgi:DNA-binding MarR family transcriptional regulator